MMMDVEMDTHLAERGVYFLPWIGEKYSEGFLNRRLLILGESHYSQWNDRDNELGPDFSRTCVQEAIDRAGAPLWPSIEQALLNVAAVEGWPPGGADIWPCVAFYNFVQSPVPTSAIKPSPDQFRRSWDGFKAVIEKLQPERIIVCGYRLWEKMPPCPLFLRSDVQGYTLKDDRQSWCLAIYHPSHRYFRWTAWHPIVKGFIDDPKRAAELHAPSSSVPKAENSESAS